jgi:hypothetical protein
MNNVELHALETAVDTLLTDANAEVDDWRDLAQRAGHVELRFGVVHAGLLNCAERLSRVPLPAVNGDIASSDAASALKSALQDAVGQVQLLNGRVLALLDRLRSGDIGTLVEAIEESATDIAQTAEAEASAVLDASSSMIDALTVSLAQDVEHNAEILQSALPALGGVAQEEMTESITDAVGEFHDVLDERVRANVESLTETFTELSEEVDTIVAATQSGLDGFAQEWQECFEYLEQTFGGLGDDVKQLGEDISTGYTLVSEAMSGAGVGASAAGSALTDVQAVMSGVS